MSSQIGSFLMGHIGVFTVFSVFERCFAIIAVKSTGEGPCIRKTVVQSNLQYRQIRVHQILIGMMNTDAGQIFLESEKTSASISNESGSI